MRISDGQRDIINERRRDYSSCFDLICACGECGVDPATWRCESKHDPEAKRKALETLRTLQEGR